MRQKVLHAKGVLGWTKCRPGQMKIHFIGGEEKLAEFDYF